MARTGVILMAYKIGPSSLNSTSVVLVPKLINLTVAQLGSIYRKTSTTFPGVSGSIIKVKDYNGIYNQKFQVFETPEMINAQVDPTIQGGNANTAVAAAGATQGAGTPLVAYYNVITSLTTGSADGVLLPTAVVGAVFVAINSTTANNLKVYPGTGAKINSLAVNTPFPVPPRGAATFACSALLTWTAIQW